MNRILWLLFLMILALAAWECRPRPASAQTCAAVSTTVTAEGLVILSSPSGSPPINSVVFTYNENARYQPQGFQSPTILPGVQPYNPPQGAVSFTLLRANPGTATTVQMRVMRDGCDAWSTLAGAGTAATAFPVAGPLATSTPVPPTIRPTAAATPITPVVIPTATPQTIPVVSSYPDETRPGNDVWLSWSGRSAPTVGDYVALIRTDGTLAGPPIFTSSCASTVGTVAKSAGSCKITLGSTFPPGDYRARLNGNNNSSNVLATSPKYIKVKATGAALLGRGQLWGTVASFYIPEIALIGGFVGMQAGLNPGDPSDVSSGDKYHHIGLTDYALLGDNFIEAGFWRNCTSGVPRFCASWPYMSWLDSVGQIQQVTWNGLGGFPPMTTAAHTGRIFQFQVYETQATIWTANFCDEEGFCCPIWESGIPCTGQKPGDIVPRTGLTRMKMIFGGSETPSMTAVSGLTDVSNPSYCCHFGVTNWTPLNCWSQEFNSYDRAVVRAVLSPCVPYAGWFAETWFR